MPAVLVVAGLVSPATASADTAEGRCVLKGETVFSEPIGGEPVEVAYRDRAAGTCRGTLNGVPHTDEPVVMSGRGSGTLGCLFGRSVLRGTFTYTRGTRGLGDDISFEFTSQSVGAMGQFASVVRNTVSGEGIATVNYVPDQTTFEACQNQALERVAYEVTTQSLTPMRNEERRSGR